MEKIKVKCLVCDNYFEKNRTNTKKKYCSPKCNSKMKSIRNRKIKNLEELEVKCFTCGINFPPKNASQITAEYPFCSSECRSKGWSRNKIKSNCKNCESEFISIGNKIEKFTL